MRRVTFFAAGLLVAALASPAAADSPAQWTAHTIPGATWAANASSTSSIACGHNGFCVDIHDGQFPDQISELRHGRVQSTIAVPLPSGASDTAFAWLNDVTCVSATSCTAVGGYESSQSALAQPLAETYDGAGWTPTVVPNPATHSAFDDVACNVDHCLAVSSSRFGQDVFARANGAWTFASVTLPAQIDGGTLSYDSLACGRTDNCYLTMNATEIATAEPTTYFAYPSGSGYKAVRAPVPAGVDPATAVLAPMSCAGSTDCTALGFYTKASGERGLFAVSFAHGTLSAAPIETPASFDQASTRSGAYLACPAAGRCVAAIGFGSATARNTLLARLQGGAWHTRVAPRPEIARAFRDPAGVACVSVDVCTVVGTNLSSHYAKSSGVVWTYSRGAWSATTPERSGGLAYTNSFLDDVACSGRVCYASGGALVSPTADKPLVAVSPRLPTT